VLFLVVLASLGRAVIGQVGSYRVDVTSDPDPIPVGKATIDLFIRDSGGKPVTGAQVKAMVQMPGMPMGEREQIATETGNGHYRAPAVFAMEGRYDATITISGPAGTAHGQVSVSTGQTTRGMDGPTELPLIGAILGIVAIFGVALRYRKRLAPAAGPLAFLALIVGGAWYAVNHFRRPGAMTPLQAQTMDMNMPPPPGYASVRLSTAALAPFVPSYRFSGQAVGYSEVSIVARTSGALQWMPFYVGDRVHKGQVLARLDTTQLTPELIEKEASLSAANAGVRVAQSDFEQAQAMIRLAQSEHGQYQNAEEEAKANLEAARQEQNGARAGVTAEEANVKDAAAQAQSAAADDHYWSLEILREEQLYNRGAVSRDEYAKEQAERDKAKAALNAAQERVTAAQAKLLAAKADAAKMAANVISAEKRVEVATSEIDTHHAHVSGAEAEAEAARQKIEQAKALARQAAAQFQGASAQKGYAELRSPIDGVITARLIDPGTIVSPGQAVYRVAQTDPIRLQANVPQDALFRVRVGETVSVGSGDDSAMPVTARVTSISSSVDPLSRMGVVEAAALNVGQRFSPGQYLTMEVSLGPPSQTILIPASAVGSEPGQTDSSEGYVWVAEPVEGQVGHYTVRRTPIKLGRRSTDQVAVEGGLQAGQKVVVTGSTSFSDGDPVMETSSHVSSSDQVGSVTVDVTASGFVPPRVLVGKDRKIVFVRKSNETCATEVTFPALGLDRQLPLNVPVKVSLPMSARGEISFECAMHMFKGTAVVQ
jgi:RND family efflux transporter MFP subunit